MICENCYETFCVNAFSNMKLFEREEEREKFFNKIKILRDGRELKLTKISQDISEEEFEEAKRNKQDSFFLVLVKRYVNDAGFSKIKYL